MTAGSPGPLGPVLDVNGVYLQTDVSVVNMIP
jgi:hypothetical protein